MLLAVGTSPRHPDLGAGMDLTHYAGTLTAPQNGSTAAGAVALIGSSNGFTVGVAVSGLQPNSTYDAQIQSGGACGSNGPVAFPLPALSANSAGDAMAFATIQAARVPAKGYFVDVLGNDAKHMPVSCGNLANPDQVVPLASANGSHVAGVTLLTRHAKVHGATTTLGTQVLVYATGLQPKLAQANHIHDGRCGLPSPVRYPLLTLVPDPSGRAIAGTGITDLVPKSGLSVHIHDSSFKLIACGNIGS
jgi:hypothetical protein